MTRNQQIRWLLEPALFLASAAPSAWLVWAALHGQLSANPLADLTNETGVWTLRFLSLTLCVTPVRRLAGWHDAIRFRRMLGLFAFYYGSLHLLTYVVADRLAGLEFENGILAWTSARDHPRWSQATERRIGEFFRRKTLMFNGYGDQVQSLYVGMDLRRNY